MKVIVCTLLVFLLIWQSVLPIGALAVTELNSIGYQDDSVREKTNQGSKKEGAEEQQRAKETPEILVKYKASANKEAINKKAKTKAIKNLKQNVQLVKVSDKSKLQEALNIYGSDSKVEYAEPNYVFKASYVPNDLNFLKQWPLAKTLVPQAWKIQKSVDNIKIAIVDTGVDLNHEDLAANIVSGYDFVEYDEIPEDANGHGTHVAGIAGAIINNGKGISGIAGGARIMPVRVLDEEGYGNLDAVADGIIWAVDNGAKVINLSLGIPFYSYYLEEAINYAHGAGVVVVAATGNEAWEVSYPAAYSNVIAVGATLANDNLAPFSNYGPEVDVVAPGVEILSTLPNSVVNAHFPLPLNYGSMSGTSMATPFVAGLAALLLSQNNTLSPAQVRERIRSTSDDLGVKGFDDYYGYGRINAFKALNITDKVDLTDQFEPNNLISLASNGEPNLPLAGTFYLENDQDWFKYNLTSGRFKITLNGSPNSNGKIQIYDQEGRQLNEIDSGGIGEKEESYLTVNVPGSYYFSVSEVNGQVSSGAYTFEVDEVDFYEMNDSLENASAINFNEDIKAKINPMGDLDYYKFVLSQTRKVEISLKSPLAMDGMFTLIDGAGNKIWLTDDAFEGEEEKLIRQLAPGTYYVLVEDYWFKNHLLDYTLRIDTDLTPPTIVSTVPAKDAVNIAVNTQVSITYSENIAAGSNYGGIVIKDSQGNAIACNKSIDKNVLKLVPNASLDNNKKYIVTIPASSITDLNGNNMLQDNSFGFTTEVDSLPLILQSSDPKNNAENVYVEQNIEVFFTKNVVEGPNFNTIKLVNSAGEEIASSKTIEGKKLIIDPVSPLDHTMLYTLNIPVLAVKSTTGTELIEEQRVNFKTGGLIQSNLIKLPFRVNDALVDPDSPIIYAVNKQEKKLYRVDYQTGSVQSITFSSVPESLDLGKGSFANEIYVTLVHAEHSSYWWEDFQTGEVAIIDKDLFKLKETFKIQVDPWDIVAGRDGKLYIPSGSGQYTYFDAYDRVSKSRVGRTWIGEQSYARLHPQLDRIYTINTRSSSLYYQAFNISNGSFVNTYNSPYYGHSLNKNFAIDPTGQFLFNGSGVVFRLNANKNEDMVYHSKLNLGFTDIAFEKDSSKIYIIPAELRAIYTYDGKNYEPLNNIALLGKGINLFKKEGELLALIEADKPTKDYLTGIQVVAKGQDVEAPVVSGTSPLRGAKDVTIGKSVTINFSENILPGANFNNISLVNSKGEAILTGKTTIGSTLVLKPEQRLNYRELYTVNIPSKAVKDGNNNTLVEAYSFGFTTEKPFEAGKLYDLTFEISDALVDPESNHVYLLSKNAKKLTKLNYETGDSREFKFDFTPIGLELGLGDFKHEIYIAERNNGKGRVTVINKDTLEFVSNFETRLEPYDISSTRDGYIMISWARGVDSYHRATGQLTSSRESYNKSKIKLHPNFNKLYGVKEGVSPSDIIVYNFSKGKLEGDYDSIYHGDYPLTSDIEIDPSGLFLYNGYGSIFSLSSEGRSDDIRYVTKLETGFSSLAFDSGSNRMFALAIDGKSIDFYDGEDFSKTDEIKLTEQAKFILGKNGQIIVLFQSTGTSGQVNSGLQVFANNRPKFLLESPVNGLETNQDTITLEGSAEPGSIVTVNGAAVELDSSGNFNKLITLQKGLNDLYFNVENNLGQKAQFKRTVTLDKDSPWITVTSPRSGSILNHNIIEVTGHAEFGSNVTINNVYVVLDGLGNFKHQLELPEGGSEITVTATDKAGNQTPVISKVQIDTVSPFVKEFRVPIYSTSEEINLSWDVVDPSPGSGVLNYDLEYANADSVDWVPLVSNYSQSSIAVSGLNGEAYNYRLRVRDKAGHVSMWLTSKKVTVDTAAPKTTIAAPKVSGTLTFRVDWKGSDNELGSGVAGYEVEYRVNGATTWKSWQNKVTGTSANFTGKLGELYYFRVRAWDKAGNLGDWIYSQGTSVADITKPIIKELSAPLYSTTVSKNTTFKIAWSGSDAAPSSGIASYEVQYRKGGTSKWISWKSDYTSTWANFEGSPGETYYFRVRAIDKQGNLGNWSSGTHKTIVPQDNNSSIEARLGFAGKYQNSASNHYLGTLRYSKKAKESITYKFTGNQFALIGYKGTGRSKAKIYIDGVYKGTIDTYSSTSKPRQVLYKSSWSKVGTHTIKVVNLGTKGRSRLDLDGIAIGK